MVSDRDVAMVLCGDLHVQRENPESIFAYTAGYLREADLFFGNLEAAVTDRGSPSEVKGEGAATFKSEERMFPAYTLAGLDAVGLANNHSMNYGTEGLLRTIELLEGAGIAHTGGGRNIASAREPAVVDRKGNRVAFLSYSSVFVPPFAAREGRGGIATVRVTTAYEPQPRLTEVPGSPPIIRTFPNAADAEAMKQDVQKARHAADVVVVSWHWGLSPASGGIGQIVPYQEEMAHSAIDAGADIVLGHHPHVLQAIEIYRGKPIFYSMGNFAFDLFRGRAQTTALARCLIRDGQIREISYIPSFINEDAQPMLVDTKKGAAVVEHVGNISAKYATTFVVRDEDVLLNLGDK